MEKLIVKNSPLFVDTMAKKLHSSGKKLADRFDEFLQSKKNNPLQPFGKSDKPFTSIGLWKNAIPNETLLHAHLTHDISIIYSITGKDPRVLKLYGVFTHDEMGTGQPANIRKQKQLAAKLGHANI